MDGSIYIDSGEGLTLLQESFGKEVIFPEHIGRAANPVVLGENEYFVLGDNRNNSSDSRTDMVGNIRREDIIGKAWVRVWPLSEIAVLTNR